ncbi:DUF4153 domain-containing protein [Clostridium botulinum]|uniref:Membrane protein n=7 Tax=Clostridium botulinum TaxID=1491 RepID=A0A9Q1UWA2_CLOBO|nr:DUF4173 domain-containing protein [Clostridium botulinum]AEB76241.1 membrane protein, putative [Clostridium botulinum BKT015925]KLU75846.1 membrane protein [Clostridium botulinum V891]KOA76088.1 membrane protein [Clostridium botulinum]KOA77503.1 membrane protein [Clostridium botulinum]KOA81412.1 membrane protein [Clostridium botulinum]
MKNNLENFQVSQKEIQNKIRLLLLSIFIGFLFYQFGFNYAGISVFIFIGILSLGFIIINKIKNINNMGIFFMIIAIFLSISYGIYTNFIFRFLNKLLIPVTLICSFLLITYENIEFKFNTFTRLVLDRVFGIGIPNIIKIPFLINCIIKKDNSDKKNSKIKNILIGLLISIPVLIFLCIILSNADSIFGHYITNIVFNINSQSVATVLCKLLTSMGISAFVFTLYDSFSMKLKKTKVDNANNMKINSIVVITIFTMVNILYIIFTKIQVCYLYRRNNLPEGFTYSDYARSGFFQLVFIVLINVISIILIKKHTEYNNSTEDKILLSLYSLITILSFNMVFSAIYKMKLYIRVFGFTRLRILVSIFTIFLAFILVMLLIFIWKNINLFKPIIICGAIIYVGANFFNMDEFITKNNLKLLAHSKSIDRYYLSTLSFDNYKSMIKARKEGLISIEDYNLWVEVNKKDIKHWYEYNYYCFKGNSIRK